MPSIYIQDDQQWGIFGLIHSGITNGVSIKVVSVADMVTQAQKLLDEGSQLNELVFGGEGGANYQSVGANGLSDMTGDKSFQLDENGNLKGGGGRYLPLLKGRIRSVSVYNLNSEPSPLNLMIAISKALGVGVRVSSTNDFCYFRGDGAVGRRPTNSATVDRAALKARLAQLAGK